MKPDLENLPMVLIEWIDSFGCSTDWRDVDDIETSVMECQTVGFLLKEDKDCYVVAPHIAIGSRQMCGDITIPRVAITGVQYLTAGDDDEPK